MKSLNQPDPRTVAELDGEDERKVLTDDKTLIKKKERENETCLQIFEIKGITLYNVSFKSFCTAAR